MEGEDLPKTTWSILDPSTWDDRVVGLILFMGVTTLLMVIATSGAAPKVLGSLGGGSEDDPSDMSPLGNEPTTPVEELPVDGLDNSVQSEEEKALIEEEKALKCKRAFNNVLSELVEQNDRKETEKMVKSIVYDISDDIIDRHSLVHFGSYSGNLSFQRSCFFFKEPLPNSNLYKYTLLSSKDVGDYIDWMLFDNEVENLKKDGILEYSENLKSTLCDKIVANRKLGINYIYSHYQKNDYSESLEAVESYIDFNDDKKSLLDKIDIALKKHIVNLVTEVGCDSSLEESYNKTVDYLNGSSFDINSIEKKKFVIIDGKETLFQLEKKRTLYKYEDYTHIPDFTTCSFKDGHIYVPSKNKVLDLTIRGERDLEAAIMIKGLNECGRGIRLREIKTPEVLSAEVEFRARIVHSTMVENSESGATVPSLDGFIKELNDLGIMLLE